MLMKVILFLYHIVVNCLWLGKVEIFKHESFHSDMKTTYIISHAPYCSHFK